MRQRTGTTQPPCRAAPRAPGRDKSQRDGEAGALNPPARRGTCLSLGLAFGATPSSRLSMSPRLPAPALPGSRRCRGAAAVRDQRGPASPAAARALSARPALLGHLGDGSGIAPGWIVPAVGCGGLAGPAELIPIVSEPLSIVIPDHKEPGGAGSGAATGRAPNI